MYDLRKSIIRLAHMNPDMRPHLIPLLKEGKPVTAAGPMTERELMQMERELNDIESTHEDLMDQINSLG